jgi:hypothetical protein
LAFFLFEFQDEPKIQLISQRKQLKIWLLLLKIVIQGGDESSQDNHMFRFMMIPGQNSFQKTQGFLKVFVCWRFKFCHIGLNSAENIEGYLFLITVETQNNFLDGYWDFQVLQAN